MAKKKTALKKTAVKKKVSKKADKTYAVTVGSELAPITGALTSGQSFSNKNLKSKTVVLYFYPKDNTPGCTLEGQDFRRLHRKFQDAGATIIGVSQDSISSHEKFKTKCDFPFELLSDESGAICKAFDVIHMKSMYGREFMGIERSTFVVKNGVIKNEWRKVKVMGHADEVLSAVKAL